MPHADRGAELDKLRKHHADTLKQIGSIDQKLSNESFVGKAPAHVVEQARKRRQELAVEQQKIEDTLRELGA
jgi:valyl-tRNA synthetase